VIVMEYDALVDAVRTETGTLLFALEGGATDDLVPTCEGWTVADLAVHVGNFAGFWCHVLCEATDQPKPDLSDPPEGDETVVWAAGACAALITQLEATPPDTPTWTWSPTDHSARFVARRSAHELAVHRFDAQAARGICTPIPAELAVDGIDEVLDLLAPSRDHSGRGSGRTMDLRSTDAGMEWAVSLEPGRIDTERRSQDQAPLEGSDLVVSGTASDIELTLYHRPTLSPVDVHGDYSVLDEWHREFTF
jgi:uncharacterized protein (TIGR03083 family)